MIFPRLLFAFQPNMRLHFKHMRRELQKKSKPEEVSVFRVTSASQATPFSKSFLGLAEDSSQK